VPIGKMNHAWRNAWIICIAVSLAGADAIAQDATQNLPGGANAVSETYGDWTVNCAQRQGRKVCTLSQQGFDKDKKQRLLAIELTAQDKNKVQGMLALPFGLLLKPGVTLQIDDGVPAAPLPFQTCLPLGCLVPLNIDAKTVELLRKGMAINIKATAAQTNEPVIFTVSLSGFGIALTRTLELSQ